MAFVAYVRKWRAGGQLRCPLGARLRDSRHGRWYRSCATALTWTSTACAKSQKRDTSEDGRAPGGGVPGHGGGELPDRTGPQLGHEPGLGERAEPGAAEVGGPELGNSKH